MTADSENKSVMILGSGRLAHRLVEMFGERNVKTTHIDSGEFKEREETETQESSMDYACAQLIKRGINDVSGVCIVDKTDAVNIYLLMAVLAVRENLRIYATFFNDNLVSDLVQKHRNVKIFNPAVIVSRLFVESIPDSLPDNSENKTLRTYNDYTGDRLTPKLIIAFAGLMIIGAWFFRVTESVNWQKSFYLVITVITSVNFNDAELTNYNSVVQVMRMGLMIATYVYVIVTLAFIVDQIVRRRIDVLMLGRRRYGNRGHVIVCGLGRVGYAIVQNLIEKDEDIIVIELDPNNRYLPAVRSSKVPVLVGDATLSHYLIDAGVGRAKALISVVDFDLTNLEIGRNARAENNNIRLILRIFDQKTADEMKKRLNIHYVFSKSFATAKVISDWIFCWWQCVEINRARI